MSQTLDSDRLLAAHQHATEFYRSQLAQASLLGEQRTQAYLRRRGLAIHTAFEPPWTLGYAPPGWTRLRDHLRQAGFTDPELLAAGLITTARNGNPIDVFRDRLIFPIRRPDGRVVAFTGRDLSGRPDTAKYRNTITTTIYQKHRLLYGLAEQLTDRPPPAAVLLVEGPADAYAIARLTDQAKRSDGRRPYLAVAPCGTAITAEQIAQLAEHVPPSTPLVIAFDGDHAGRAATEKGYPVIRTWPGPVEGIHLPDDTDPADLVASHPIDALQSLEQARRPLIDLLIDQRLTRYRLDEIPGRFAALGAIAPLIADAAANDTDHAARLLVDIASRLDVHPLSVFEAVYPSDGYDWLWDTEPATATEPASTGQADDRSQSNRGAAAFPDQAIAGHRFAIGCPTGTPAVAAVTHDSASGTTAWAVAEGVTGGPHDRYTARLAAEVASRAAVLVGARHAIEIARMAVNTHFQQPGTGRGDAVIAVLTTTDNDQLAPGRDQYTIAWAGDIRAYGVTPTWFAPLTVDHTIGARTNRRMRDTRRVRAAARANHLGVGSDALTASVRGGPIAVNHITATLNQIIITGRALSRVPTATIRGATEQRTPAAVANRLSRLGPSPAAAVVVRPGAESRAYVPTAPRLARQDQIRSTHSPSVAPAPDRRRTPTGPHLAPVPSRRCQP